MVWCEMKRKWLYFSPAPAIRFSPLCLLFPTPDILEGPISFPVIFQPKYSLTGELRVNFSSPRVCSGGAHSGSGLSPPPSWGWAPCPTPSLSTPCLSWPSREQSLVKGAHFEKCKQGFPGPAAPGLAFPGRKGPLGAWPSLLLAPSLAATVADRYLDLPARLQAGGDRRCRLPCQGPERWNGRPRSTSRHCVTFITKRG